MLSLRTYYIFLISLTIIPLMLFSSNFPSSALAFHTASTANDTIYPEESTSDANNEPPAVRDSDGDLR